MELCIVKMKRGKTITRTLVMNVNTSKSNEKLVASLNKKQFVVLMYLLRGMKIKVQKLKEIKEQLPPSEDDEFEKRMLKGVDLDKV